ncbi:MAG TPA: DnaA/Hda family protein, partial [Candidatus Limnocylindrales bacterium]|nr:DnaA/Hda family protein [Candidatus Limnocylindrales bacterium]
MAVAFSESAAREAWSRILGRAKAELPDTTIVMWFSDVRPIDLHHDVLTLAVPSPLVRERLQHNHLSLIEEAAADAVGRPVKIELDVEEGMREAGRETNPETADQQGPPPAAYATIGAHAGTARAEKPLGAPGLPFPNYTFDAFVPGPSNRFAHAAAMAVAEAPPSTAYNPLFI